MFDYVVEVFFVSVEKVEGVEPEAFKCSFSFLERKYPPTMSEITRKTVRYVHNADVLMLEVHQMPHVVLPPRPDEPFSSN